MRQKSVRSSELPSDGAPSKSPSSNAGRRLQYGRKELDQEYEVAVGFDAKASKEDIRV
jgi:hypothetical protein